MNLFIFLTLYLSMAFSSTIFYLIRSLTCVREPSLQYQGCGAMGTVLGIKAPFLPCFSLTRSLSRNKEQIWSSTSSAEICRNQICIAVLIKTLTRIKEYCFQENLGLSLSMYTTQLSGNNQLFCQIRDNDTCPHPY